jgi:hypothetical protein
MADGLLAMTDRLDAVIDRLHRAEEHFEPIKAHLLSYYRERVGLMTGEFDPDNDGSFVMEGELGVPDMRLHTLIGELIHDLHSSLEHLAWQLVEANGGEPGEGTCFPVLKVAPTPNKKGEQSLPNIAGGVSEAARTFLDKAQPYKFEERYAMHPLWVLRQLWNIDKHRHVVARGIRSQSWFPGSAAVPRFTFTTRLESVSEDGARFAVVPDDPSVNVDAHTTIEVGIHEPEHEIEKPLLGTLKDVRLSVMRLVMRTEALGLLGPPASS